MQEIAFCTTSYASNNCANPLPALILQCLEWETCMARDPAIVGRAKVGAEMLAEVINSFVEPISWKTLASYPKALPLSATHVFLAIHPVIDRIFYYLRQLCHQLVSI